MSIDAAVYTRLTEELDIDFYPLTLPPSVTLPAGTYRRVSTAPEYTHNGDALLERIRWQFDVWAETYAEACQQADTLRAAWSGYSGQVYETPAIYVDAAFIQSRRDLFDPETQSYRTTTDVTMWVRTVE